MLFLAFSCNMFAADLPANVMIYVSGMDLIAPNDSDQQLRSFLISRMQKIWTEDVKFIMDQLGQNEITSFDFVDIGDGIYFCTYRPDIGSLPYTPEAAMYVNFRNVMVEITDLNTNNKKVWLAGIRSELNKLHSNIPSGVDNFIEQQLAFERPPLGGGHWCEVYNDGFGNPVGCDGDEGNCECITVKGFSLIIN